MSNYVIVNGELYHHGVKGMKWGHRKKTYSDSYNKVQQTKKNYKQAKKQARADKTIESDEKSRKAKENYKAAKHANKQAKKDVFKELQKKTSIGEKLVLHDGIRRRAAAYVVDNNMPLEQAYKTAKKEYIREASIFIAVNAGLSIALDHIK